VGQRKVFNIADRKYVCCRRWRAAWLLGRLAVRAHQRCCVDPLLEAP
jgi:hypothetical protein